MAEDLKVELRGLSLAVATFLLFVEHSAWGVCPSQIVSPYSYPISRGFLFICTCRKSFLLVFSSFLEMKMFYMYFFCFFMTKGKLRFFLLYYLVLLGQCLFTNADMNECNGDT